MLENFFSCKDDSYCILSLLGITYLIIPFNLQIKNGRLRLIVDELCAPNDKAKEWESEDVNSEQSGSGTLVLFIFVAPNLTTSAKRLRGHFNSRSLLQSRQCVHRFNIAEVTVSICLDSIFSSSPVEQYFPH